MATNTDDSRSGPSDASRPYVFARKILYFCRPAAARLVFLLRGTEEMGPKQVFGRNYFGGDPFWVILSKLPKNTFFY